MNKKSIVPAQLCTLCERLGVLLEELTQTENPEGKERIRRKLRRKCFGYLARFQIGHPILRRNAEEVSDVQEVQPLIAALVTMMRASGGIGLAAPQVGLGLRVAVVECSELSRGGPTGPHKRFSISVLINPIITAEATKLVVSHEGCLSHLAWGNDAVLAFTRRPESITARYLDEHGVQHEQSFDGLHARAVQHEIEHLDGIFFHERVVLTPNSFTTRRHLDETRALLRQHGIEVY